MHLMCIYALLTNEQISFRNYNLSDIQLNRAQARRRRSFQTRSGSARRAAAKMNDIY